MRNWTIAAGPMMALVPVSALGQDRPSEWGWGMHPGWWMWGIGGVVMPIMMLAFWGLLIAGLVLGIRWLVQQGQGGDRGDRALDILRERYARGEINKEEFEARRRDLGGRGT